MSAKELCAKLITRKLSDLSPDEKEDVYYWLDDRGYDLNVDMSSRTLCSMLMQDLMKEEVEKEDNIKEGMGRSVRIPMTAYANKVLQEEKAKRKQREKLRKTQKIRQVRQQNVKELQNKIVELPGCIRDNSGVIGQRKYLALTEPNVGLVNSQGTEYTAAFVTVPQNMYGQIFDKSDNPILEITAGSGIKTHARIEGPHDGSDDIIFVSVLIAQILQSQTEVSLKLCVDMPIVKSINFTYYGTEKDLSKIEVELSEKLPEVINMLASLQLGMELQVALSSGIEKVLISELRDTQEREVYSAVLPLGLSEIPFEVKADI